MTKAFISILFLLVAPLPAAACGPESDCMVGDRSYRLYVPDGEGPMGAFFFAHGHEGSGGGAMSNMALRHLADEIGMAFVALDSAEAEWDVPHTPYEPDRTENHELAYVTAVLADLPNHFDLDPTRIVASGFSSGGMMTWTLVCDLPEPVAGFVAMSGTFWAPVPETCTAPPRNVVHIHGTEDRIVPFEGRDIGEAHQGNVPEAIAMYRAYGGFEPVGTVEAPDGMTCETSASPDGVIFDFCTFEGGHSFSTERLRYGIARVLGGE
jgi:polyhydroxybutyrate depolymerase